MLLEGAAVTLRRDAEGLASWTPGTVEPVADETDGEATEPGGGPSLPTVREMRAENLSVVIDDAASGTTASFDVAANGSTLPGRTSLVVAIEGVANEVPVNGRLELESPLDDISPGEPVRLALELATDGAVLGVAGGVDDVVTLDGLDLRLDLDVESLAALGAALDRKPPPLAPATFVATVRSGGDGTAVAVEGSIDGAPVRADLELASSIRDLRAGGPLELDLDAMAGGAELALAGRVGDPGTFADVDLELDAAVDSLVALESLLGRELPDLAPATFSGSLRRDDGEYVVRRFDLAAAGSELEGDVRADPATTPPSVHADLISTRLDVDALLEATGAAGSETEADEAEPKAAGSGARLGAAPRRRSVRHGAGRRRAAGRRAALRGGAARRLRRSPGARLAGRGALARRGGLRRRPARRDPRSRARRQQRRAGREARCRARARASRAIASQPRARRRRRRAARRPGSSYGRRAPAWPSSQARSTAACCC